MRSAAVAGRLGVEEGERMICTDGKDSDTASVDIAERVKQGSIRIEGNESRATDFRREDGLGQFARFGIEHGPVDAFGAFTAGAEPEWE